MGLNGAKVYIVCITYNHEKYIRQALDGFLSQKTSFKFTVIAADDGSTDKTQEIIKGYADKYPGLIRAVLREKNIGPMNNFISALSLAGDGYLAICEGDDYWTDPDKLQKQADYLDANPGAAMCFHPVRVFFDDNSREEFIFPDSAKYPPGKDYTSADLIRENFIQTNSVMYRWKKGTESLMPPDIMPGDYFLHLLVAKNGAIHCMDRVMSDYRRHSGGLWYDAHNNGERLYIKYGANMVSFWVNINEYYGNIYRSEVKKQVNFTISTLINVFRAGGPDTFIGVLRTCPPGMTHFRLVKLFNGEFIVFKGLKPVVIKVKSLGGIVKLAVDILKRLKTAFKKEK